MSRRHAAEKREFVPDAKYGDLVVAKFMNSIMYEGKKSVAESIVYGAFDQIEQKAKTDPLGVFKQALENVAPSVEVRASCEVTGSSRAGGGRGCPPACGWPASAADIGTPGSPPSFSCAECTRIRRSRHGPAHGS